MICMLTEIMLLIASPAEPVCNTRIVFPKIVYVNVNESLAKYLQKNTQKYPIE